jgi:hypothetical protein
MYECMYVCIYVHVGMCACVLLRARARVFADSLQYVLLLLQTSYISIFPAEKMVQCLQMLLTKPY